MIWNMMERKTANHMMMTDEVMEMTNVYLRDLSDELQLQYRQAWKDKKLTNLLKADREEKDIAVGEYFGDYDCRIMM